MLTQIASKLLNYAKREVLGKNDLPSLCSSTVIKCFKKSSVTDHFWTKFNNFVLKWVQIFPFPEKKTFWKNLQILLSACSRPLSYNVSKKKKKKKKKKDSCSRAYH